MSNRNKHNSIVFLTTLSVYLGLVLVGAPASQVLAQIEKSQNEVQFPNASNNSEFKRFIEFNYTDKLTEFAQYIFTTIKLDKLKTPKKISDENFYAKITEFAPYLDESGELLEKGLIGSNKNVEWMVAGQFNIMADIRLELLNHFRDFLDPKEKESVFQNSVEITLENSEYRCELVIKKSTKQKAAVLANQLEEAVNYLVSNPKSASTKQIYENTKVSSENNQVLIVTRLPRGSLDELLKNAKAESK